MQLEQPRCEIRGAIDKEFRQKWKEYWRNAVQGTWSLQYTYYLRFKLRNVNPWCHCGLDGDTPQNIVNICLLEDRERARQIFKYYCFRSGLEWPPSITQETTQQSERME